MDERGFVQHLEELQLIKCSLLPNEILKFTEDDGDNLLWARLLDAHDNRLFPGGEPMSKDGAGSTTIVPVQPAVFRIEVDRCGFEVAMPFPAESTLVAAVSAKGNFLGRAEQERWQDVIKEKVREVEGAQYPTYELLSLHLLPLLHDHDRNAERLDQVHNTEKALRPAPTYHALLTSHHLVSAQKRRSLHEWSSLLDVSGFAKVGHPGVIYAQGERQSVEEFVANVKSMQWLALRVRFVESVGDATDESDGMDDGVGRNGRWKEFQKVGEVVEEMKRLGREKYVTEMGIGSARAK